MFWWKKLFGQQENTPSGNTVATGQQSKSTPSQRPASSSSAHVSSRQPSGDPLTDYKRALAYLDSCGPFNERTLRETNRIAGGLLDESTIQASLYQAQMIMPTAGEPGGMEFIKAQVRENLATLIQMAERMGLR